MLLAADGMPNAQIARTVGVSRPTVIGWRDRYRQGGVKGLEDEPRSGRPLCAGGVHHGRHSPRPVRNTTRATDASGLTSAIFSFI